MNFFAVMFLSSVILVLTVAVIALSAVVRKNLLDIDALQVCVLHLLTEDREEPVINNTYNFDISGPANEDTETKIADIQALFNKMPEKEAEQLADVIKLHGDKIDGNVTSRTVMFQGDGPIKKIVKITTKKDNNNE